MKKLLLLLAISPIFAQVYTPPAAGSGAAPAAPAAAAAPPASSQPAAQPSNGDSKSLFGNELPFVDPSDETISMNGRTWSLGNNRLIGARFEKYLSEPEEDSDEAKDYRKTLDVIIKLAQGTPTRESLSKAVRLLTKASSYSGDAKICDSLANAIYTAANAKAGISDKKQLSKELEEEQSRLVNNMSVMESSASLLDQGKGKPKIKTKPTDRRYVEMQKRALEIEVLKKKYEGESSISLVQAKLEYQALLVHLFMQRRFHHVLLGCRFYGHLFKDGDSKLKLEKGSDSSRLFGESVGMPPTISSLDSLASEAIRDNERHIAGVKHLIARNELCAASKRLGEAFLVGEFLVPTCILPREDKQKVQDFMRASYKLLSCIDAKDYARANKLIQDINKVASDFDAVKAESAIAAYTRASDLCLYNAKKALQAGDEAKAQAEIQQAIAIWPRNPKLDDLDKALVATDEIVKARQDFDRLLAEKNFRQIFKDQYRYAPVIAGDATAEAAFKDIIININKIDMTILQAAEFSKMGQDYAAWEALKKMREDKVFSEDSELGRQIENITPRVSDLSNALTKAQTLEEADEVGSAMSWHLRARQVFPKSGFAEAGINRLLPRVLD